MVSGSIIVWSTTNLSGGNMTNSNWGGSRKGAGRPATGRKKTMFYITQDEKTYLQACLQAYRANGSKTRDEFENELEARGQQMLPLI